MKVRVQIGHWGRKTGATGAYNSDLKLSEASMNKKLADEIEALVKAGGSDFEWEFLGPDVRPYRNCDVFIALHMDGSNNKSADGPSVGFPVSELKSVRTQSNRFAEIWKTRRNLIPGAEGFRATNYTRALQYYYGYKSSYSSGAKVKVVLENGFVSNNDEVQWAIANRTEVAQSIIDSVHEWAGVPVQSKSVFRKPKDEEVVKVELSDYWQVIQKATGLTYSAEVELWQRLLTRAGFPAVADGLRGPKTEAAHREWCDSVRLTVRDVPGRQAWKIMLRALTVQSGDPSQDERVRQLDEEVADLTASNKRLLEHNEVLQGQLNKLMDTVEAVARALGATL